MSSRGKQTRVLKSVHFSQIEKQRILSEQSSFHDHLEKEADQAFQGDLTAQTRLSGARAELDSGTGEKLILISMQLADILGRKKWNSVKQIN